MTSSPAATSAGSRAIRIDFEARARILAVFSRRTPPDLGPNALAQARLARGEVPYDLTVSNPTACGIPYPPGLLSVLGRDAGLRYEPDPRGLAAARRAIAADHRRHGLSIAPDRVVVVASSSEAYSMLFKLTCDPGDAVLLPQPSYPLFEHLARLDGVRAAPYLLHPAAGWQPVPDEMEREPARAVVVVHPNNPTGSYVEPAVARSLARQAARLDRALIADEVFLDYPLSDAHAPSSFLSLEHESGGLGFVLGGLSKSIGLPQLKLSWIVVTGPEPAARDALERLDFIADQYLSVGTPVQQALPELLAAGAEVRASIRARCRSNLVALRGALRSAPAVSLNEPEGGWSAVLRYPSVADEMDVALELLDEGVGVHPGELFGFPGNGWLVIGLLAEPSRFAEGVRRLLAALERRAP